MSFINKNKDHFRHPSDLTVSKVLDVARNLPAKALQLKSSAVFATGSMNVVKVSHGVHVSVARLRGVRSAEARSEAAVGLQIEGRLRGRSSAREIGGAQRTGEIHDGMLSMVGLPVESRWVVNVPAQSEFESVIIEFPLGYFRHLETVEPVFSERVLDFISNGSTVRRPMSARQKMLFAQIVAMDEAQPGHKLFAESVALSMLFEAFARNGNAVGERRPSSDSVSYALEIIEERLQAPPTIGELAKLARMSETGFKRAFSKAMGRPVGEYILSRRMELARELAGTGLPVARIASDVGYATPEAFSKAFQRHFGVSPRQYQDRNNRA